MTVRCASLFSDISCSIVVCSYGFYGANCSSPCVCDDGCSCDHITGSCNHTVVEDELIQGMLQSFNYVYVFGVHRKS